MENPNLQPEERPYRRKVFGMAHTWEVWVPCWNCEGTGYAEEQTCSICHGECGQYVMEVDE